MNSLTPTHIAETLRAVCYGRRLPKTPLVEMDFIRQNITNEMSPYLIDFVVTQCLLKIICEQLHQQQQIHKLNLIDMKANRQQVESAIVQAFESGAVELQAWIVLYVRYVRTDLNLSMVELGSISASHPRTLRRRQYLGFHHLYEQIISHEQHPQQNPSS